MDSFVFDYINSWGQWIYIGIFIAMLIDGNITLLLVGFLSTAGVTSPFYGILACFGGGLLEQLIWYWIGIRIKNSGSKATSWVIRITNHFDEHFRRRPLLALFISKFIYGLHRGSLARVAVIGVPIRKFLKQSVPVLIAWALILFIVGFSVSKPVFYLLEDYVHYVGYVLLGLIVVIVLLERFVLSGKLKKFWQKI